jgi:hypothetical protein
MLLALTIGPVFFLVSAQAPLMQRWFALHPGGGALGALCRVEPGQFRGLIAYPLLVEPLLSEFTRSGLGWSLGYGPAHVLVVLCARARRGPDAWRSQKPLVQAAPTHRSRLAAHLLWLVLAAVPSGLMLSTTTHLTTDIFAMPLLWVIPLGIYLLSFVIAFADGAARPMQ